MNVSDVTRVFDCFQELQVMGIERTPANLDIARKLILHVLDDHIEGKGIVFTLTTYGYAVAIAEAWCCTVTSFELVDGAQGGN